MKQKASGEKWARINAHGFEQIPGIQYDPNDKSSPVVNMTTIWIILTLWASCEEWNMQMLDVKEAFLKGEFNKDQEQVYLEVLQRFEHIYKQIGQELEAGEIPEGKELERAMEIHQQ